MASFQLVEAFVQLTAKGGPQALSALQQITDRVERMNQQSKSISPLLDYARSRGLNVAAQDAGRLAEAMQKTGGGKPFDAWIDGQVRLQKEFERGRENLRAMTQAVADFQQAAATGFAAVAASVTGFVRAASPDHWNTLTGSVELLSAAVGQIFLPAVEQAIDWLQDLAFWFHDLDPATKQQIATWTLWGGAILGAAVIVPRLISVLGFLNGLLSPLNAGLRIAAGGFSGLGSSVKQAAGALTTWLAANPATAILAVVGVVVALAQAFGGVSSRVQEATNALAELEAMADRLRGGGQATRQDVRRLFQDNPETYQRLVEAQQSGNRDRLQRQINEQLIVERARLRVMGGAEGAERSAAGAQQEAQQNREQFQAAVRNSANPFLRALGVTGNEDIVAPSAEGARQAGNPFRAELERTRARIAVLQRGAAGLPDLAGRHNRLSNAPFHAQMGGIELAWQRLQMAAAGGSPLQAQLESWRNDVRGNLQQIAQNTRPESQREGPFTEWWREMMAQAGGIPGQD